MKIMLGLFFIFTVLGNAQDSTKIMEEEELEHETEEITINATRSTRTIENEPTRVEFIGAEELDEKISMDPSGISMILNESTGIQVQQISPFSADNTFRIHGLPGRYTQLLKDGFPLYSGLSSSLSLLQTPPLDLKQIEIIKGSASTLYGGGAIAGIINLITKQPTEKGETSILLNGTSALGFDASIFSGKRNESLGYTVLAAHNRQQAYAADNGDYADIPEFERYVLNPRLYIYPDENSNVIIGGSFIYEDRWGGLLNGVEKKSIEDNFSVQRNLSRRANTESAYKYFTQAGIFSIKNSFNYFNRITDSRSNKIKGEEVSSYTETSYSLTNRNIQWIAGLTLQTENSFIEENRGTEEQVPFNKQNSYTTAGIFLQSNVDINEHLLLELGTRLDYNTDYKFFFLPRLSLLYKWTEKFTTRLSSGLGYLLPTFLDDNVSYFADKSFFKPETSYDINFDFNYTTALSEDAAFSINQLFFYTRIENAYREYIMGGPESLVLETYDGRYFSRGIETNIKFSYKFLKLYAGYSYNFVSSRDKVFTGELELTPRHRIGLVLFYEKENDFKIGWESYYTGNQHYRGVPIESFWISGIMAEKKLGNVSLFINFENLFNFQQLPLHMFIGEPEFVFLQPTYASREGRVINGGVKLRF